jgi:acyl carrier protein
VIRDLAYLTRSGAMHNNLTVKVRQIVAGHFKIDPGRLKDEARFQEDLGADWLDRLELLIAIEDRIPGFEMADVVAGQIDTVGDLVRTIEGRGQRISVALESHAQARR